MKRILIGMVLCGMLTFAGSSWADIMVGGTTNVGSLDTLVASTDLSNSGDATELAWINQALTDAGLTDGYTSISKVTSSGGSSWLTTDLSGVYALALNDSPDYFLVKTGGAPGTDTDFLFKNLDDLAWAVVQLSDLNVTEIDRISHVSEVGGGTTQVPEPGMLLMFGSGLVVLGFFSRKKFKK